MAKATFLVFGCKPRGSLGRDTFVTLDTDICYVEVYGSERPALIDPQFFDVVAGLRWHLHQGYAIAWLDDRKVLMHTLILPGVEAVDHIHDDRLDNRLSQIRPSNKSLNGINRGPSQSNVSGHRGVWFDKIRGKWTGQVTKGGRRYFCGRHDDFDSAVSARDSMAVELFGEHARVRQ